VDSRVEHCEFLQSYLLNLLEALTIPVRGKRTDALPGFFQDARDAFGLAKRQSKALTPFYRPQYFQIE